METKEGVTLLDYFAAKAMQSELTINVDFHLKQGYNIETHEELAVNAYNMAEAMVQERNKRLSK